MKRSTRRSVIAIAISICGACSSVSKVDSFDWMDGAERPFVRSPTLSVRWIFRLAPEFSDVYLPVENAAPAIDLGGGRIFTGSTNGTLWALSHEGKRIYRYSTDSPIETAPAFDPRTNQLYVGTVGAEIHALNGADGSVRWRAKTPGPIRQSPLLLKDALYVVTENDSVTAFDRSNGEVLWRYRREETRGLSIAGQAGLVHFENKLLTAFSDGAVVALDPGDGSVLWEHDTSLDVEGAGSENLRLLDVDTTPIVVDGVVYVASFSAGLYALTASGGAEVWRNSELTSVTTSACNGRFLVLSSANQGVLCLDLESRTLLWRFAVERGAPGEPTIAEQMVFVGESGGAFLALSLKNGAEIARIEFGHGFSAPASTAKGRGFVLSNSGTLLAFNYW
ncbi:MAG: PQQ-binding-like beta-propeller repeat protein [Deltaproteobacteria bacterium]|nr:PQQ-binding-like beta-propeller repeat protein [Deltaproteobacteria bacterium]